MQGEGGGNGLQHAAGGVSSQEAKAGGEEQQRRYSRKGSKVMFSY